MKKRNQLRNLLFFENNDAFNHTLLGDPYDCCELYPFSWSHDLVQIIKYNVCDSFLDNIDLEEEI